MINLERHHYLDSSWEQPQGLCDLIGHAFRLWRSNLRLIFKVIIGPTLVMLVGACAMQLCFYYAAALVNSSARENLQGLVVPFALMGIGGLISLILLGGYLIVFIREMALARLFAGFSPDWKAAEKFCSRPVMIAWIVLTGLLVYVGLMTEMIAWFTFMFLAGIVAGITAGAVNGVVGGIVAVVLLSIVFIFGLIGFGVIMLFGWLAIGVLSCEDTTVFGAVGRVFEIAQANFSRMAMFGLILSVVMCVMHVCLSAPAIAITIFDLFSRGVAGGKTAADTQPSLYVVLISQVWESLTNMMLRPVTIIACTLMYLDHRRRTTGIDISRKLVELRAQSGESP